MQLWLPAVPLLLAAPFAANQPEPIGPFGGSAAVIQTDPRNPGTVVAATSNALIYRSTDGGDSWTAIPFPASLRATLHAFAITPGSGAYLAGLADDTHLNSGLFRSMDGGDSWERLGELGSRDVWSIAVFGLDSRIIAAGTGDGVFLTRDAGAHWLRISPESNLALRPVVSLAFDLLTPDILYAGTPHLPWITENGGETWALASTGMEDDSDVFSIHVEEPLRHVFASACSGIYQSFDRGASWTKLAGAEGASIRTYRITQHPRLRNVFFAGTAHGLIKSTDGGKTWRRVSKTVVHSIAFDIQSPNRMYFATDGAGLLRSDDVGETLHPINNGFRNRRVLSISAAGRILYASSAVNSYSEGIFRRDAAREKWEVMTTGFSDPVLKIAVLGTRVIGLTSQGLLISPERGRSWQKITPPPTRSRLIDILTLNPSTILVAAEDGIYVTGDLGHTWSAAQLPALDGGIRALISLQDSVAAITRSMILMSADGLTYRAVPSPSADGELHALVGTDFGALVAATSHGVRRSDDGGTTWQSVKGLNDDTIVTVCRHSAHRGMLFAARYGEIYASIDDGRSWAPLTSEQQHLPPIKELVVAPDDPTYLYALTHSQGVYRISLDPIPIGRRLPGSHSRTPHPKRGGLSLRVE